MAHQAYKDPTFETVAGIELKAKGCIACERYTFIIDRHRCPVNKRFPACKRERGGFVLK